MCGFTGLFLRSPFSISQNVFQEMVDSITHRGPDDVGFYQTPSGVTPSVFFGFRRLALVDLTHTGAQPMTSFCGRYVMVYNGETYSNDELRPLLKAKGIVFRGHSDTEVILEAIAVLGLESALQHLNGMFAIALYDKREQSITLIRDRVGIKPLYWMNYQSGIAFASELKALMPLFDGRPAMDQKATTAFLRYGYVPAPLTIYDGIFKLTPGTFLTLKNDTITHHTYWSMDDVSQQPKLTGSLDDHLDEFHALLRDSVYRCMHADVPIGSLLSGGIDSSLVTALMQSQAAQPIATFTIGFHEKHFNEAEEAKKIAAHLGTDHHELYVTTKETQDVIPLLSAMYDEPFADPSAIPTFLVSQLAGSKRKAVLSGDGGDELFAGYKRYFILHQLWNAKKRLPLSGCFGRLIANLPSQWMDRLVKIMPPSFRVQNFGQRVNTLGRLLSSNSMQECYQSFVGLWNDQSRLRPTYEDKRLETYFASNPNLDVMEQMQFIDTNTYLPDDILTKVDRASMRVSLEGRVPLLDHRLIEMAWRMPTHWKVAQSGGFCGLGGQIQGKLPLRAVLEKYIPKEMFDRPKMGFGVPLHDWLRGDLVEWAEDLLFDPSLADVCDVDVVRRLWHLHKSGAINEQARLWAVLMLQSWRRL